MMVSRVRSGGGRKVVAGAALSACCLVAMLAAGCGESKPAPVVAPVVVAPPQPPPVPPEVDAIADVRVKPGEVARLPISIKRNGNLGLIELVFENPPPGITVEGGSIPAGTSRCELVIKAAESLGDQELMAPVSISGMVNGVSIQASFNVIVPQYEPPEFMVDRGVILVQRSTRDVALRVDRKGFPGPIGLTIGENTPESLAGVTCSVEPLEANDDSTTLQISVADDVADGMVKIPLVATVRERPTTTELPFTITRYPYRLGGTQAVVLAPGASRRLTLPIERNGYDGPLDIEAVNLPSGMELPSVVAAAGASSVDIDVRCDPDMTECVVMLMLRASGADLMIDSPLVVRISSGDDRSLPEAVRTIPKASTLLRKGSFGGRTTLESKQSLRDLYGGTPESDAAVMRGLAWLARVQQPDGGWALAGVTGGAGEATAAQPAEENRIVATALGLLPFLAEGITHKSAPEQPRAMAGYKPAVEQGLVFLARQQGQGRGPSAGSWNAGMKAQALATIAFCEAYSIGRDPRARLHAQQGVRFLLQSQDPSIGGWRNAPNEPPDLVATAWVIMALRAAQLANVSIKARQLEAAEKFVTLYAAGPPDSFESRYASGPGRDADPGLTAAVLLARLHLGWGREQPQLLAGRDYLVQHLPPVDTAPLGDLFLYHFATQVLQQIEGPEFDGWNALVREHLIRNQHQDGELAGSWDPQGMKEGERSGRLYATVFSLLTLQTYYRHLPMFRGLTETEAESTDADPTAAESGS